MMNIEQINATLKDRQILCISEIFLDARDTLKWECDVCKNQWFASYKNIRGNAGKRGTGCPRCASKHAGLERRLSDNFLSKLAIERKGKFLGRVVGLDSKEFKANWQCRDGHRWEASISHVRNGTWCPKCVGKHKSILDLVEIGKRVKLKLIDTEYLGMTKKYSWLCEKCDRHVEIHATNVAKGRGCRWCAGKSIYSIEDCNTLASSRDGYCLTKIFRTTLTPMKWQCSLRHPPWEATFMNVKGNTGKPGTWCPHCTSSLGERLCRLYFESLFKKPFIKATNLLWMKSKRGTQLTLDGYNEELRIAFEHQGNQHYKMSFWHSAADSLKTQLQRDNEKKVNCLKNGITLIEIEEVGAITKIESLKELIIRKLKENNIEAPFPDAEPNIGLAYSPREIEMLADVRAKAAAKGYRLLSKNYKGVTEKLRFQCKIHGEFKLSPHALRSGDNGCRRCGNDTASKKRRKDPETIRHALLRKSIEPISIEKDYKNSFSKITLKCLKCSYKWNAMWVNMVKPERGCPSCNRKGRTAKNKLEFLVYRHKTLVSQVHGAQEAAKIAGVSVKTLFQSLRLNKTTKNGYLFERVE